MNKKIWIVRPSAKLLCFINRRETIISFFRKTLLRLVRYSVLFSSKHSSRRSLSPATTFNQRDPDSQFRYKYSIWKSSPTTLDYVCSNQSFHNSTKDTGGPRSVANLRSWGNVAQRRNSRLRVMTASIKITIPEVLVVKDMTQCISLKE
jgi:hypothetical protein